MGRKGVDDTVHRPTFRISHRLIAVVSVAFLATSGSVIGVLHHSMRQQALQDAAVKARLILDHNLATHTYFSHQLKPSVFKLQEAGGIPDGYFDASWMSSTYAVREIHGYFASMIAGEYYYKESAVNARSPLNEADPLESAFLEELRADPQLVDRSAIRVLDGAPYFVVMRRGEAMEASCLRCHSTPEQAPADLVAAYGPTRSFGRQDGELVSAISIRIPLAEAYESANAVTLSISGALLAVLGVLFVGLQWVNRRLIFAPLEAVRDKARQISTHDARVGDVIPVPDGQELAELTQAFNSMSLRLRAQMDGLEGHVEARTTELFEANRQLAAEVEERKQVEQAKEQLIKELRSSLAEVKTLKGFIPICSYCKKIRDDSGFWSQVEAYISRQTEAQFSHGICPDCEERVYRDEGLTPPVKAPS